MKTKAVSDVNWRNVEEVVIPPIKRQEILLRSYLCDYSDAYTILKRTAVSMIEQTKN